MDYVKQKSVIEILQTSLAVPPGRKLVFTVSMKGALKWIVMGKKCFKDFILMAYSSYLY